MPLPVNIIYLHSHDTGRYIQPYGFAVPTPHLQRLAERGTLFRQAFCAGPTCSPSRAALLTGTSPHVNGMIGLRHRGFRLRAPQTHLAAYLGQHGYLTAAFGNEHVTDSPQPDEAVWQTQAEMKSASALERSTAALTWLDARSQADAPFFLSLGYFETHRVFPEPGPGCDARYTQPPACLPDTPETRADFAAFTQMARNLDTAAGAFLDGLAERGLLDNALIIHTTDHGIAFPRMKCNLQDSGIGVLLSISAPGLGLPQGAVVDSMVTHLDLYPTICELAGIPSPDWLEGKSLVPLLRGQLDATQADALHQEIFAEVTYHAAYEPMRAVRTPRWKFIRRFEGAFSTVSPNCDDSPSKAFLSAHANWRGRPHPEEALFDLFHDPQETDNLAQNAACREILHEMRCRLDAWMERTDDPLLRGPVPLPVGAIITGPGQPS